MRACTFVHAPYPTAKMQLKVVLGCRKPTLSQFEDRRVLATADRHHRFLR